MQLEGSWLWFITVFICGKKQYFTPPQQQDNRWHLPSSKCMAYRVNPDSRRWERCGLIKYRSREVHPPGDIIPQWRTLRFSTKLRLAWLPRSDRHISRILIPCSTSTSSTPLSRGFVSDEAQTRPPKVRLPAMVFHVVPFPHRWIF